MYTISTEERIADLRHDRDCAILAARAARALDEPEMVKEQVGEARFLNKIMVRAKRLHKLRAKYPTKRSARDEMRRLGWMVHPA